MIPGSLRRRAGPSPLNLTVNNEPFFGMTLSSQQPWASGPGEILRHGVSLLKADSDVNRRLAMIAIDNAVELTIKTYLGLPKRINGLAITRREFQEAAESFPALLDALENHAEDKLDGIDLGAIEWYHRLRNELYHQGNGLTVERDKVEVYAELANTLFKNLFGFELVEPPTPEADILGEFLELWLELERGLMDTALAHSLTAIRPRSLLEAVKQLEGAGLLERYDAAHIDMLRRTRNEVVHGLSNYKDALTPNLMSGLRQLVDRFRQD
jgi:hypothetical protein